MVLATALFAAASLTTGLPFVNPWTQTSVWPQPLDWIAGVLSVECWPTHTPLPLRLLAWALGAAALGGLAAVTRHRSPVPHVTDAVLAALVGTGAILVLLAAVRAVFASVPLVGLMWTWQLALALAWMLGVYVWTVRLGGPAVARAVALSLSVLAAVSLLFRVYGRLRFPNIPTGNVLFLTTACLAGLFLTATWAYASLSTGWRERKRRDLAAGLVAAGLTIMMLAALWLASRRAALVGLAAGAIYIVAVLPRGWPGRGGPWRGRQVILATVLAVVATAAVLVPLLYKAKRWESILYRVELYKATVSILLERPATALLGIGPGHLCFQLTTKMRPLHAESPRLFHGQVEEQAHSEPLQAIAELGLPLGLLYLALPLGGLIGFVHAYPRSAGPYHQLTLLGAGAALAATLAAEATSVGMRHPGVASLVWTLVGIGWASGTRTGEFGRLTRWLQPVADAIAHPRSRVIWSTAGIAASLCLVGLAWRGLVVSGHLYRAQQAANRDKHEEASRLLSGRACVPTAGDWMAWKYVQGMAGLALMEQDARPAGAAAWRAKARVALTELVDACPVYEHAPIYLSDTYADWDRKKEICERFLRYDPYDYEARLTQASYPGTTASEQMQAARLAIRNTCINPNFARMMGQVAQDPAAADQMARWMADAARALQQPEPARWPDPLALESLRIAVVLAGRQGRLTEALELAGQAVALARHLAGDPWRNRPEEVVTEVYLDHAWFHWLLQPEEMQQNLEALHAHLLRLPEPSKGSFSRMMTGQFVAMLWLAHDQPARAEQALRMGDPAARPETIQTSMGLACARLVALAGSRPWPQREKTWSDRGIALLGQDGWRRAVEAARLRGLAPWWFGVLAEK